MKLSPDPTRAPKGYAECLESSAWYDLKDRGIVRVTGTARVRFLHGMLSQDIVNLKEGIWATSALLTTKGKLQVFFDLANPGEALWIVGGRKEADLVPSLLTKYVLGNDVKFSSESETYSSLILLGPETPRLLLTFFPEGASGFIPHTVRWFEVHGEKLLLLSRPSPLSPSYEIIGLRATADRWKHEILSVENLKSRDLSDEGWEALRVEGGVPQMGKDLGEETLLPEVPILADAVSYTKGCYLGQETIARLHARGNHVAHRLMGLESTDSNRRLEAGSKVMSGEKEVGKVTSVVYSPKLRTSLGMALIHRDSFAPGTVLEMSSGGQANVIELPIR